MLKKLFLIFILFSLLFSCGKKGDPEYKTNKNSILLNKI